MAFKKKKPSVKLERDGFSTYRRDHDPGGKAQPVKMFMRKVARGPVSLQIVDLF